MKPIYPLLLLIFTAIFVIFGCKKDEGNKPVKPYNGPAMQGKSVAIYPDGGVTFTGTFLKVPDSLRSYGFIVSGDSLLHTDVLYFPATGPAALGDFKVDANAGLVKGKKYYYSPFWSAYSEQIGAGYYRQVTYFNIKSFNSDGSKSIKVDSIYPLKADIGDTITIKGKYFANQGLGVTIGGQYTYFLATDSVIKFTVPQSLNTLTPTIVLQYTGHADTVGKGFTLNTPVISSFTSTATFRDTITITGDHFGYANNLNEVDLGAIKATIVSSSRKQLKVIIPDNVPTLNSTLTVKAQLQSVTSPSPFRIRRPVITSVTQSALTNDLITVTGKYFHPLTGYDALYFEHVSTPANSGTTTQITASLPPGPYPRRKVAVAVKFLDTVINWSQDITLKDKWVWVSAMPFAADGALGSFTINNTSYVVAPAVITLAPMVYYLWKFNPADLTWQQINIPFNITYGIMASTASKAYLYTTGITDNFWEYDPASNTWTEKATYPAGTRYAATMFTIGAKVYLGLGQGAGLYGGNNPPDNTLYQYDIASNTWAQKASYPADSYIEVLNATSMVFGNKAVVFGGANIQNYDKVYSYDATADTWAPLGDFNSNTGGKNAFVYNGYGFVAGMVSYSFPASDYRSCFKYNSATDTWAMLPDGIGQVAGLGALQPGFTFINNGIVYEGGVDGPYSQLYSTSVSGL
ncbi:MAG: IPT/TIG domain-containing protein [Sphingobacteriales bacterium]